MTNSIVQSTPATSPSPSLQPGALFSQVWGQSWAKGADIAFNLIEIPMKSIFFISLMAIGTLLFLGLSILGVLIVNELMRLTFQSVSLPEKHVVNQPYQGEGSVALTRPKLQPKEYERGLLYFATVPSAFIAIIIAAPISLIAAVIKTAIILNTRQPKPSENPVVLIENLKLFKEQDEGKKVEIINEIIGQYKGTIFSSKGSDLLLTTLKSRKINIDKKAEAIIYYMQGSSAYRTENNGFSNLSSHIFNSGTQTSYNKGKKLAGIIADVLSEKCEAPASNRPCFPA